MAKASGFVLEITSSNFKREVLDRSRRTPVVLDFWASWCGPCRTLSPVLEKLAEEGRGAFYLGKVDTEKEAVLAQQFGVQSIPFVVAMMGGQPVDGFVGALPESEVRRFLDSVGIRLEKGEAKEADPDSPEAAFASAGEALRKGDLEKAREALARIPEEHELHSAAERISAAIEFFSLRDSSAKPGPAAPLSRAAAAFREGRYREALEECLASVRMDSRFKDSLARRGMVGIFTVLGEEDPLTDAYRKRLAETLY